MLISTHFSATGSDGVRLTLNNASIANNSYVDVDDIGEGDAALLCHTNKTGCCGDRNGLREGEWYFPNGDIVRTMGGNEDEFYRDRATKVVRLNHQQGTFAERGCFRCNVPDASNTTQTVYVNIGKFYRYTILYCRLESTQ